MDGRGEYVDIANDGSSPVPLTGVELADYRATHQHVRVYIFPTLTDGSALELHPGQSAYVFSGEGLSEHSEGSWLLHAGWTTPIWNNNGDVAYLRSTAGQILDSMTVGHPRRHPNGH
jgi:hypothetical protein